MSDLDLQNPTTGKLDSRLLGIDGAGFFIDPAAAPVGTVSRYEDQGLPSSSTALFTGKTFSMGRIKVKQNANAGAAVQYGTCYIVINSSDPPTDLADASVRIPINIGEDEIIRRPEGTIASIYYLCANTSVDVVLQASFK